MSSGVNFLSNTTIENLFVLKKKWNLWLIPKKDATTKSYVYYLADTRSMDFLDLNDYGPKENYR